MAKELSSPCGDKLQWIFSTLSPSSEELSSPCGDKLQLHRSIGVALGFCVIVPLRG